jgi:hypothetical protein
MRQIPVKSISDYLTASEFNEGVSQELNHVVSVTGQTFLNTDLTQLAQGIAIIGSTSASYVDSGTANQYTLTSISTEPLEQYETGMVVSFIVGAGNTGASTVDVNSLGTKAITRINGNPLAGSEMATGAHILMRYDGAKFVILNPFMTAQGVLNQLYKTNYVDSGSSNAYVVTSSGEFGPKSLATGLTIRFFANASNTGAATVDLNGLGVKAIKREDGTDVVHNDIIQGESTLLVYNGTNFILASLSLLRDREQTLIAAKLSDNGSVADAYVADSVSDTKLNRLIDGMLFSFIVPVTNTGISTLKIDGFGSPVQIVKTDGSPIGAGALVAGKHAFLEYCASTNRFKLLIDVSEFGGDVTKAGNNDFTGLNTFDVNLPTSTVTPTGSTELVTKAYADTKATDTSVVHLAGSENISGTKTFTGSLPRGQIAAAPTLDAELTPKKFVDDKFLYPDTQGYYPASVTDLYNAVDNIGKSLTSLGQVKMNGRGGFKPNYALISDDPEVSLDYTGGTGAMDISASPTTTWPKTNPATDAYIVDHVNKTVIENAVLGQVHTWRFIFTYTKAVNDKPTLLLRLYNILSSFSLTKETYVDKGSSGSLVIDMITIADGDSIPAPVGTGIGYHLALSCTEQDITVTLESLTRISYAVQPF